MFLNDHARIHRSSVAPAEGINLGDYALRGVSEEMMRKRSPGHESIAWFMWHITRCEDIVVNSVLRRDAQVLDDDWCGRLGVSSRIMGTGMTDEETEDLSSAVDLGALIDYRDAVGLRTREYVQPLDFDSLDLLAEAPAATAAAAGAVGPNGGWVGSFWDGRTRGWFLSWVVLGHSYQHLAEVSHVATLLGRPGR